jgi:hypothetical protein
MADPTQTMKELSATAEKFANKIAETGNKVVEAGESVITDIEVNTAMLNYQSMTPWHDLIVSRKVPTGIKNLKDGPAEYPQTSIFAYHLGRATRDTVNYINYNKALCFSWALIAVIGLSRPVTFGVTTLATGAAAQFILHRPVRLMVDTKMRQVDNAIKKTYKEKINPHILKVAAGMVAIALLQRFKVFTLPNAAWYLTSLAVGTQAGLWLSDWAVEATKVSRER